LATGIKKLPREKGGTRQFRNEQATEGGGGRNNSHKSTPLVIKRKKKT